MIQKPYILPIVILFIIFVPISVCSQIVWEEVPLDDSINTYRIDFDNSGKSFIATNYGLYSSEDDYYWERSNLTEFVSNVYINENNTIYAGMNKLSRSFDGGLTWDSIFFYHQGGLESIYTIGDSIVLLGTWGGIFLSVDSAQTWEHVLVTYNMEVVNSIVSNSEGTLFAGSTAIVGEDYPGGVYRSFDNGATWELSNMDYYFVSAIAINSNDEIFAATRGHFYTGGRGVFKSIDGGESWEQIFDSYLISGIDINSSNEIAIGCANQGPPYGGVFCSYDNGLNWQEVTNNLPSDNIRKIKFNEDGYLFVKSNFDHRLHKTQTIVSILSNSISNGIPSVFPNPACSELNIPIDGDKSFNYQIVITNQSGIKINNTYSFFMNGFVKVNVANLNPGLYFIYLTSNKGKTITSKFIKQ